jgi:hypothetical protein
VLEIWNNYARISVIISGNCAEFKTPKNFNPREPIAETLEQMVEVFYNKPYDNHFITITIEVDRILNNESKDEEIERMLAFIQTMRISVFRPEKITFSYIKQNPSIGDRLFAGSRIQVNIYNWSSIEKEELIGVCCSIFVSPNF